MTDKAKEQNIVERNGGLLPYLRAVIGDTERHMHGCVYLDVWIIEQVCAALASCTAEILCDGCGKRIDLETQKVYHHACTVAIDTRYSEAERNAAAHTAETPRETKGGTAGAPVCIVCVRPWFLLDAATVNGTTGHRIRYGHDFTVAHPAVTPQQEAPPSSIAKDQPTCTCNAQRDSDMEWTHAPNCPRSESWQRRVAKDASAAEPERCAVCGWPLKQTTSEGCVRGNCSMRPLPERAHDPARAIEENGYYEAKYGAQIAPTVTHTTTPECACGGRYALPNATHSAAECGQHHKAAHTTTQSAIERDMATNGVVQADDVSFGRPRVAGTGIPVEEIASRWRGGDDIAAIADDFYSITPAQVEKALRFVMLHPDCDDPRTFVARTSPAEPSSDFKRGKP